MNLFISKGIAEYKLFKTTSFKLFKYSEMFLLGLVKKESVETLSNFKKILS
jgi:hypothetical protein